MNQRGYFLPTRCMTQPHLSSDSLRQAFDGRLTAGNSLRHSQGRVASMTAREFIILPAFLSAGLMRGSSGVDQAREMMSMELAGSDRVQTAHINSSKFVTSMSSSTTTM